MAIGVDIVSINRISKTLEKNRERFYERIFTYREIEYIVKKNHNSETIAGLFASKEAVSKVFGKGIGAINWKDIEIAHDIHGKPQLNLNEKLLQKLEELKLNHIEVSISHERNYAVAFAIGYKENGGKFSDEIILDHEISNIISKRNRDTHKGDYGRALIIGGSRGMTGSMTLSSKACTRTGVGLNYALVPESLGAIMSIKLTEEIVKTGKDEKGYFIRESLKDILESIKGMDVVAIGPGMGDSIDNTYILAELIKKIDTPLVIDADGINGLSKNPEMLFNKRGKIVITPHPGELSKLIGISVEEIQKNRIFYSKYTSEKYNIIIVLKGSNTIVCRQDDIYVNHTGNPGMATAGSGDVLTGIITSLIAQGIDPFAASKLGVYIHGLGGDYVKYKKGEYGIIASDILEAIPYIIEMILNRG